MLFSLTLRKTDQPQLVLGWMERVSALLQENPSFAIQMDIVFSMSVYYLWKGEYNKNAVLLEKAEAETSYHKPPPFTVIRIKLMKGIHCWITAEYDSALNNLSEGLDISDTSGVHVFDSLLWNFRTAAEMAPGNMAQAVFMQGRTKDAKTHIHTAHSISLDMKSYVMEWYSLLISAWFLLKEGKDKEGLLSYQRLMLCYLKLDNKAEAVKAYKRCSSLFRSELGIESSDKTKAIYSSILKGPGTEGE